jgi:hypothetical protein
MRNSLRISVCVGVLAAFALLAASVGVSGAPAGSAVAQTSQTADTVQIKVVIDRFVRQGRHIVAKGAVIGRYQSDEQVAEVARRAFTARLKPGRMSFASSARICKVLELDLRMLHLELLGLIIDLSRLHLTITADSEGGLLGALFCSIAGTRASAAKLRRTATKMTQAARANGMHQQGIANMRAQVAPRQQQAPGEICTVLDLVLGPLDLNILGLMIHLDRVRLLITADPNGGILGSLLCSLSGGPGPPPPPPAPAPLRG